MQAGILLVGIVAIVATCSMLPERRIAQQAEPAAAPPGPAQAPADSTSTKLAVLINMNGQLCASVERVQALKMPGAYEVECILYRGGSARGTYVVDLSSGRAQRQ